MAPKGIRSIAVAVTIGSSVPPAFKISFASFSISNLSMWQGNERDVSQKSADMIRSED